MCIVNEPGRVTSIVGSTSQTINTKDAWKYLFPFLHSQGEGKQYVYLARKTFFIDKKDVTPNIVKTVYILKTQSGFEGAVTITNLYTLFGYARNSKCLK